MAIVHAASTILSRTPLARKEVSRCKRALMSSGRRVAVGCMLVVGMMLEQSVAADLRTPESPQLDLAGMQRVVPSRMASDFDARNRLDDLRSTLQAKRAQATPDRPVERDDVVARKRMDVLWGFERGLKDKSAVDLTRLGFKKIADGTYEVSGEQAKELSSPFLMVLRTWSNPVAFDRDVLLLAESGFRDQDVEALGRYLRTVSVPSLLRTKHRQLMDQMASTVRARRARGSDVTDEEFVAFMYQVRSNTVEAEQRFIAGAFAVLDQQRQRALTEVLQQLTESQFQIVVSTPNASPQGIKAFLDELATGSYVQTQNRIDQQLRAEGQP